MKNFNRRLLRQVPVSGMLLGLVFLIASSFSGPQSGMDQRTSPAATTPAEYEQLKAEWAARLAGWQSAYALGGQKAIEARREARLAFLKFFEDELAPAWMGTEWAFSGTTTVPGKGKIACGYFVTTLLRDAGFRVERVRMAQQASLNIIRSLTPRAQIKDYAHLSPVQLAEKLEDLPMGLYVMGLDIHTGFILNKPGGAIAIHASYLDPVAVVREPVAQSAVLGQSKRFVLGQVDNDWLLGKWLAGEAIATQL